MQEHSCNCSQEHDDQSQHVQSHIRSAQYIQEQGSSPVPHSSHFHRFVLQADFILQKTAFLKWKADSYLEVFRPPPPPAKGVDEADADAAEADAAKADGGGDDADKAPDEGGDLDVGDGGGADSAKQAGMGVVAGAVLAARVIEVTSEFLGRRRRDRDQHRRGRRRIGNSRRRSREESWEVSVDFL